MPVNPFFPVVSIIFPLSLLLVTLPLVSRMAKLS